MLFPELFGLVSSEPVVSPFLFAGTDSEVVFLIRKAIITVSALLAASCLLLAGVLNFTAARAETVYWGSRGETVRQVQTKLKQWGYYTGGNRRNLWPKHV